jgi:MFS family permease
MGTSALIVHLIPYFESIGFTRAQGASVLGFYTVLSIFGRLGGGWIMDYVDKRLVLAGLLVCQVIGLLILANVTTYWQTVPFALFYGVAFGGMIPSTSFIVSAYFGTRSFGTIQGFMNAATAGTGMIAPVLMGWIFDKTQSYVPAIIILMAVAAAAIPLTFFARPPRPRVESAP